MKHWKTATPMVWTALAFLFASGAAVRAADSNVESQLRLLQQQNDTLQSQLQKQQELIDALRREVTDIRETTTRRADEIKSLREESELETPSSTSGFSVGKVQISGEGGIGWFETGSQGAFPNSEFRVDEAKLFVDAPVWGNVYAFAELNLASHDASDVDLRLGELYLDIEDVSQLWGKDRQLNLRLGRIDIPFGEEYQNRDAIDNPLVSHSLADIWGVDEGIEIYGAFGNVSYAAAVQNGGIPTTRDFTSDKSIAGRLSYDPKRWLHLSVSGMRTGDLDAEGDGLSESWYGGGWFRPIGATATTFHANLVQGDLEFRLPRGHVKTFGGYVQYGDNDPAAQNRRDVYYYSVEGFFDVTRKLYAAARFGQIFAPKGFPLVGNGNSDTYLFGPLSEDLWRLSLGLGYRWNRHFVVKAEYSIEQGKETSGRKRNHEDMIATEAAFGF